MCPGKCSKAGSQNRGARTRARGAVARRAHSIPIPNEEPGRTLVPLGRERGGGAEPGGGEGGQPGFGAAGRRPHPSGGGRVAPGWAAEPGAGGGRSSDLGDQQRDDDGLGCCSEDGERLHSGGPRSAPRAAGGAAEDARAGPRGARRGPGLREGGRRPGTAPPAGSRGRPRRGLRARPRGSSAESLFSGKSTIYFILTEKHKQ